MIRGPGHGGKYSHNDWYNIRGQVTGDVNGHAPGGIVSCAPIDAGIVVEVVVKGSSVGQGRYGTSSTLRPERKWRGRQILSQSNYPKTNHATSTPTALRVE